MYQLNDKKLQNKQYLYKTSGKKSLKYPLQLKLYQFSYNHLVITTTILKRGHKNCQCIIYEYYWYPCPSQTDQVIQQSVLATSVTFFSSTNIENLHLRFLFKG